MPSSRGPEIRNRDAPSTNGGRTSTPNRIARYVDPQNTYTHANETRILTREPDRTETS
jgi:hypothetical protein